MKKIKKFSLILAIAVMFGLVAIGCSDNNEKVEDNKEDVEVSKDVEEKDTKEEKEEKEEEVKLEDWEGTWNNLAAYLDDEELKEAFVELAEREESTVEEAKKSYLEKRNADFDGMVIDKDTITFLDGFKDDNGKEIESAKYEYKKAHTVQHGNFEMKWYVFEADGDAKYKNILLMPVHGVETLTHFHMRYGNDVDEMLENEDWYPTFVKPSSTYDQLYEEITE